METNGRTYQLGEVFNEADIPTLTFVEPRAFNDLVGSLRTKGKHITLSGPSGSGKTTLAKKALDKAGIGTGGHHWVSGRDYSGINEASDFFARAFYCSPDENEYLGYLGACGILVIDDFHHLAETIRNTIGLKLKRWAEVGIRVFIIGIAGLNKPLLDQDSELAIRNDPYEMKRETDHFIAEVITQGEKALNIRFDSETRAAFVKVSLGVPSAIQLICRVACDRSGIYESCFGTPRPVSVSLDEIKDTVLKNYKTKYQNRLIGLAKGKQQARSVHNTYFEIVKQVCTLELSEIPIAELYNRIVKTVEDAAEQKRKSTSFYNCLNNLSEVINQRGLGDTIYYDKNGSVISIEDPSFRLYLTLANIEEIERSVRVRRTRFPWDIAVSFAGEDRPIVERFRERVNAEGYTVYYDFDEQHRLWGENLRRKLSDVYANDAQYMVVFLSKHYPEKNWTNFELDVGRQAKAKRTEIYLLPIILDDVHVVGISSDVGHVDLRKTSLDEAVQILVRKVEDGETKRATSETA